MELRQDEVTTRAVPATGWSAIGGLVLALVVASVTAWEVQMRRLGLRAGDLDDGASHWTVERRKIAAGKHDGVVIHGSSRILFDTDLDVWEELTGRRPIQLALPGTNPRFLLRGFAQDADFSGLVIVGVTPAVFFTDFTTAFPEYLELNTLWLEESPSRRFGHQVGLLLSRRLAFLDDQYRLGTLVDQLDIPDRPGVRRPHMRVWKLSESFDDRQYFLWPRLQTDARLREHAKAVWRLNFGRPVDASRFPAIIDSVREDVEKIRSRGGDVVFVRAPSDGDLYERELSVVPRAATWDPLLERTGSFGIHFEDHADMRGLDVVEMSHLSRESATRFTRAYVAVLVQRYPWLDRRAAAGS
ncbi:MAG: hypothetical protein KF822_07970 [Steroidobacteraceae bacterium]|nr:hypothetical protein [Steroidobacteraceae bacterium]